MDLESLGGVGASTAEPLKELTNKVLTKRKLFKRIC